MSLTPVRVLGLAGKSGGTFAELNSQNPILAPYVTLWAFDLQLSRTNWTGSDKTWLALGGVDNNVWDEKGPKGDIGLSPYEEAVGNGFVGEYEDWALTQKGEDGTSITGLLVTTIPSDIPAGVIVMKKKVV